LQRKKTVLYYKSVHCINVFCFRQDFSAHSLKNGKFDMKFVFFFNCSNREKFVEKIRVNSLNDKKKISSF
jgi:hypothetical protein